MQTPPPKRWRDFGKTEGLLLFAQRLAESLFDYTLDSYKAPALNTHTRCQELLDAVIDVRQNGAPKDSLSPLYEELAWSIKNDSAAQVLLGAHALHFSNDATWRNLSLRELGVHVRQIRRALRDRYADEIIRQLRAALPEAKEKQKIVTLTTNLVIEWVNRGYSKDYIFFRIKGFFFSWRGQRIASGDFEKFVALFDGVSREWEVTVRGNSEFSSITDLFPEDFAIITAQPPAPEARKGREVAFYAQEHSGVYVTLKQVEALDARGARDRADLQLKSITNMIKLHIHRKSFAWSGDAIVRAGDLNPVLLKPSTPPIHKEREASVQSLPTRLQSILAVLNPETIERESLVRLATVMNLHATAMDSRTIEAQLFSLWAALESLLPLAEAESRIGRISELTIPILSRHYPSKILSDLHEHLKTLLAPTYRDVLANVQEGNTVLEKCAALIAIQDYKPLRDRLYASAGLHPLLKFRLFSAKEQFATAEGVLKSFQTHSQRVSWHLRRIYRSRNLLVHTGRTLPYRETLVENLHSYVDRILELLVEVFARDPQTTELDAALMMIRLDHQAHIQHLTQNKKTDCTGENYHGFIFGPISG